MLTEVVFCSEAEIREQEEALWADIGLPARSLDECPYAAVGPPERVARLVEERRRRLGLSRLFVTGAEAEKFCREVLPLLS
jgi:hypothetical protein